jgi:hypothetical protein
MQLTWDDLLVEARARGRRWGEHFYKASRGAQGLFPSMLDRETNRAAHDRVGDLAPLDARGELLVEVCYCAARDTFNSLVSEHSACPVARR